MCIRDRPKGREFWKAIFSDAWPQGQDPNSLMSSLEPGDRVQRRLGLAIISLYGTNEIMLLKLMEDPKIPIPFRLMALQRMTQRPDLKEESVRSLIEILNSPVFDREVVDFLKTASDDAQWTGDLFENPLFSSEDGKAFLTGVAVILRLSLIHISEPTRPY